MNSTTAPIVVGVDDAPGGLAALRFAVREAIRRGSPLDIVTVWTQLTPTGNGLAPSESPPTADATWEWARASAQHVQDRAVAETIDELDVPPVLSRQVVEGDPAKVLLRIARNADYLVVGSSRRTIDNQLVLGAVSQYCVEHSTCPVLVVPAPVTTTVDDEMMVTAHD
jgi:nucleotide-binding universal stress UspA family protein